MWPTRDDIPKELRVSSDPTRERRIVKTRIGIPVHGRNHPVDVVALGRTSVCGDQLPDRLFIRGRSGNRLGLRRKGAEDHGKEKAT